MISSRALRLPVRGSVVHPAVLPCTLACVLYLGAPAMVQAQSGDGPVAGVIVDQFNELYGEIDDVIVTTACLEGNPFVPDDPPAILDGISTLSGCKLDIPTGGGSSDADNNQLITVLPNNFKDGDLLTNVNTYGSGSNTALELDVTVNALSKDIFLGLANPELFGSPPAPSDVETTADAFCTSIDGSFDCAQIEPCLLEDCSSVPSCGELIVESEQTDFCADLSGLLENAYNLERNPLAYAISTNMSTLALPESVTLRLCPGFQAQCLPHSPIPIVANANVTSMHTQNAAVDTPRLRMPYY